MKIPHVAFGNKELTEQPVLKDEILCPRCGKQHKIFYGKKILKDGTEVESKFLAGYHCGGKSYLAGINGKDVTLHQRKH